MKFIRVFSIWIFLLPAFIYSQDFIIPRKTIYTNWGRGHYRFYHKDGYLENVLRDDRSFRFFFIGIRIKKVTCHFSAVLNSRRYGGDRPWSHFEPDFRMAYRFKEDIYLFYARKDISREFDTHPLMQVPFAHRIDETGGDIYLTRTEKRTMRITKDGKLYGGGICKFYFFGKNYFFTGANITLLGGELNYRVKDQCYYLVDQFSNFEWINTWKRVTTFYSSFNFVIGTLWEGPINIYASFRTESFFPFQRLYSDAGRLTHSWLVNFCYGL
ncbi:hypothetical protein JW935_10070 [candidate division KSB1 bacterium]|nr:hypothetical protein [candidate division KSB1 bacterium]